jgi:hypothetical protein
MRGEEFSHGPGDPDGRSRFRAELRVLYAELDAEVAGLGPVCQISGRCCRFRDYGHTLFVSTPEIQFLLSEAPEPVRPLDQGDTCPWQDRLGRCAAREARPLGCRVYHCDPVYQPKAPDVSERFISRLQQLAERHGLAWNYAPLHRHLHQQREQGRFPIDLAGTDPA